MSTHPNYGDLRSKSYDTTKSDRSSHSIPSPRVTQITGDIAKSLSPLAALQEQTKRLARQLNDSQSDGRRASRLPPLSIANSLVASSPEYSQKSTGTDAASPGANSQEEDENGSGNTPDVEEPTFRPQSHYIRMSGMDLSNIGEPSRRNSPDDQKFVTPAEYRPYHTSDYFAAIRTHSPEPLPSNRKDVADGRIPPAWLNPQRSFDSARCRERSPRVPPAEPAQRSYDSSALAPPMSPHYRQGGSLRSVPADSSDDDLSASTGGSSFSQQRKLSSCSGVSMPLSPFPPAHGRSPSLNSEYSIGSSSLARPTVSNFSRPLSRQSRPSVEITSRQPSIDSRPSLDSRSRQPSSDSQRRVFTDESVHTQSTTEQEMFRQSKEHQAAAAPSYIYAKFSLPRGRMLQRDLNSIANGPVDELEWEHSPMRSNVAPAKSHVEVEQMSPIPPPPSTTKSSMETPRSSERPSSERTQSRTQRPPPTPVSDEKPSHSSASMRSGGTIKARSNGTIVPSREVSAEEHLAKGIELHENGSLKESTYHLRIAAKSSLPTAMLLYALACRHGWGMRPNPEEGVQWLRKAADSASLEIADDEGSLQEKESAPADALERKTRRAQFALSIYELGVSHMKGWGIEMDKALALRCFEIAGSWGDADAMTEAGFCYYQGTGCKKDLKKAAKYYRMAEAKGVSMVGNSWIYKPKYADDIDNRQERPSTKQSMPGKQPRDKSRTRTLFGRKKSISTRVS
ncbi:hypothetical protein MMC29_008130 [Sticta canariensis]|nr:hypothetical protein [Sticta canariensis]